MALARVHLFRQPTYGELKVRHDETITTDRHNRHSAINGWMRHHGYTNATVIENEFGTEFNPRLVSYLAKFAPETQAKRSSILRRYQGIYFELVEASQLPATFHGALKVLIVPFEKDLPGLARTARIALENLKGWVENGVIPGFRSEEALGRLEAALEAPVGTLTNRLPHLRLGKKQHRTGETVYGRRVQELAELPFRLPLAKWPAHPRKQWKDIVDHKTRVRLLPGEKRNKRWNVDKRGKCQSANMRLKFIENFFGFLTLAPNPGEPKMSGLGLRVEDLDLALLADPELLEPFIEFLAVRSGVTTEIGRTLLDFIYSLCQEETGWFCQQPAMASHPLISPKLPSYAEIRRKRIELTTPDERWMEWLNCTCKWIKSNQKSMQETYERGRDHEAIEPCLAMKHPMDWLFQLADTMEKHLPVLSSRRTLLAVAYRNLLLVRFLIANPLRIKMFAMMTYKPDNTGHLHQRPGGNWWLRFPAKDFKNFAGAAKEPYCVPLSKTLFPYIERYLKVYRPILAGASACDYVFRPMARKDCDPIAQIDEEAMSDAVRSDTQHYLPESKGFGPHGFRHIIATDTIRNDRVQGWQRAATALHDTLETVRKNYAHLRTSDHMEDWNDYHDLKMSRTDSHYRDPKIEAAMEILQGAASRGIVTIKDLLAYLESDEKKSLFFKEKMR